MSNKCKLQQLRDPLVILHVRLPSRHLLHMPRIHQQDREPPFQNVIYRSASSKLPSSPSLRGALLLQPATRPSPPTARSSSPNVVSAATASHQLPSAEGALPRFPYAHPILHNTGSSSPSLPPPCTGEPLFLLTLPRVLPAKAEATI